ncbi:hypothetical protein Pmani_015201 [Petrolisthes manimaculis]|uniref:PiggyBac transposable element-derived protein domain-containing protein n=1 Tax=Petrolisthes manimaculis TaxID=1843537 RepID=A0AAE1U7L0_9EUCA|nr:hypothetical protein Pmani_015201 [Petrolisthes manimaculis]
MAASRKTYDLDKSNDLRDVLQLLGSDVGEIDDHDSVVESDASDDSVEKSDMNSDDYNSDVEMPYVRQSSTHHEPNATSTPQKHSHTPASQSEPQPSTSQASQPQPSTSYASVSPPSERKKWGSTSRPQHRPHTLSSSRRLAKRVSRPQRRAAAERAGLLMHATRPTSPDLLEEEFEIDNPEAVPSPASSHASLSPDDRRRPPATARRSRSRSCSRSQPRPTVGHRSRESASAAGARRVRQSCEIIPEPNPPVDFSSATLTSTSGFQWQCQPHRGHRHTAAKNIIREVPGPTAEAQRATTIDSTFSLFFPDEVITEIVKWTNKKISSFREAYKKHDGSIKDTNPVEMRAFLGLLLLCGVQKSGHLHVQEIFSKMTGSPPFRATMSARRFSFLNDCLRFDDPVTRVECVKRDKLAPQAAPVRMGKGTTLFQFFFILKHSLYFSACPTPTSVR